MLCDCCVKVVEDRYKINECKDTYEKLFYINKTNGEDIEVCSWCWKTITKIDKFRKMAQEAQMTFSDPTNYNFLNNNIYNLQTKIYVNHFDLVLVEEVLSEMEGMKNEYFNTAEGSDTNETLVIEYTNDNINRSRDNINRLELQADFKNEFCGSEKSSLNSDTAKEISTSETSAELKNESQSQDSENFPKIIVIDPSIINSFKDAKPKTKKSIYNKPKVLKILQKEFGQEGSQVLNLHSHIILTHHLVANIPAIGEKYGFKVLTEEEVMNDIKLKSDSLKNDDIKYKCLLCHESFNNEQQQNEHVTVHQYRPNAVLCKFCNIVIDEDRNSVITHYREHFVYYNCKECDFSHTSIKEMSSHYSKKHATYKCQRCNKVFNSRGSKNYHIIKEHRGSSHQCNQCGNLFSTIISLKNHMEIHNTKSYTCDICGKAFPSNSKYQYHRNVIHLNVTHIQCKGCEKVFKHKSSYNKHMRETSNHQSERTKFKCSYCDNEYLGEAQMKLHVNVVHFGVGLTCYICGKLCQTRSTLNRHVKSHGDKSDRTRDHICDHCGKTFFTKQQLKEHMNIHSDDRPQQCKYCYATFKFKSALYTHINLVHKKLKKNK